MFNARGVAWLSSNPVTRCLARFLLILLLNLLSKSN